MNLFSSFGHIIYKDMSNLYGAKILDVAKTVYPVILWNTLPSLLYFIW